MLKINVDNGKVRIVREGVKSTVMAEMMMAVQTFYNMLDDKDKRVFKASFEQCDVLSDEEDEQEQEQEQEEEGLSFNELMGALDALKEVLKELSE